MKNLHFGGGQLKLRQTKKAYASVISTRATTHSYNNVYLLYFGMVRVIFVDKAIGLISALIGTILLILLRIKSDLFLTYNGLIIRHCNFDWSK